MPRTLFSFRKPHVPLPVLTVAIFIKFKNRVRVRYERFTKRLLQPDKQVTNRNVSGVFVSYLLGRGSSNMHLLGNRHGCIVRGGVFPSSRLIDIS